MRILILGAGGFVGHHLARRLQEEDHIVWTVDDHSRGKNPVMMEDDLTLPGAFRKFARHPWDQVYVLAAVVGVPNVEARPGRTLRVNAQIVLQAVQDIPTLKWFFASSSETYAGVPPPVPTPEDVPLAIADIRTARSTYAVSKMLGESAIIHSGTPFVIARFHNLYGPNMGEDHVIPKFIRAALRRQDPFPIDNAAHTRAFCYIDDAVTGILIAMAAPGSRIVNIGNDEREVTGLELAQRLCRLGRVSPVFTDLGRPGTARRCPDLTRMRRLGYAPEVSLADGLRRTWRWYADHPA